MGEPTMPEEPEIETENLHEMIHEKKEHAEHAGESRERRRWISGVAVTTAVIAALAAIAALEAGDTVNKALMYKSEASIKQTERSNQWMYYQAKGTREFMAKVGSDLMAAQAGPNASQELVEQYRAEAERYKGEKMEVQKGARKLEQQADELNEKAEV